MMDKEEIRAIALEVAKELLDEPLNIGQADHYIDFATRFLAAINAKAEPVAWLVRDQVDGLRYPCNQKNPAGSIDGESEPLFTHPAIEPAPQTTDESTSGEHCASGPAKSVGAAPLPDDVAKAVRLLRVNHWVPGNTKAADLIERLARQVPPAITHDEWYAAQNRIAELLIFVKKISKQIPEKPDYWNSCSQCEHNASEAEDLLIAAGEVKP